MQSAATASSLVRVWPLLLGLTLVAFALRVVGMDQSLYGDELFAYEEVEGHSLIGVLREVESQSIEVSPPLFFVLAWLSAKLGDPTIWIRLPSLIAGTALVPVVYLLGSRTVGRPAALLAAALTAIAPFAIFYATEARPYATLTVLVALSTWSLLSALESRGRWWWAAYAVAAAAAIYAHYTGVFVLAAQALWAIWAYPAQRRPLVVATLGIIVLYLPWLPFVRGKESLPIYGTLEASADDALLLPTVLIGHPFAPLDDVPGAASLVVLGAVVVIGVGVAIERAARRPGPPWTGRSPPALLILLAVSTPLGLLLSSTVSGHDLLNARNLSASVPAATLLLAALLTPAPQRLAPALALAATAAGAAGTVTSLDADHQRPPSRDAAATVDAHAGPRDSVVDVSSFFTDAPGRGLRLYLTRPHPLFTGRTYNAAWKRAAGRAADVFVVFPGAEGFIAFVNPPRPMARRFRLASEWRYPGLGDGLGVRKYSQGGT
jgi:mannosyltransferase